MPCAIHSTLFAPKEQKAQWNLQHFLMLFSLKWQQPLTQLTVEVCDFYHANISEWLRTDVVDFHVPPFVHLEAECAGVNHSHARVAPCFQTREMMCSKGKALAEKLKSKLAIAWVIAHSSAGSCFCSTVWSLQQLWYLTRLLHLPNKCGFAPSFRFCFCASQERGEMQMLLIQQQCRRQETGAGVEKQVGCLPSWHIPAAAVGPGAVTEARHSPGDLDRAIRMDGPRPGWGVGPQVGSGRPLAR